jgi:hypothetical protein
MAEIIVEIQSLGYPATLQFIELSPHLLSSLTQDRAVNGYVV